jgi:hypothetical protein
MKRIYTILMALMTSVVVMAQAPGQNELPGRFERCRK